MMTPIMDLRLKNMRNTYRRTQEESCSREMTSKTTTDTTSQVAAARFLDTISTLLAVEKAMMTVSGILSSTHVGSSKIAAITGERVPTPCGYCYHPAEDQNNGTQSSGKIALVKKMGRSTFELLSHIRVHAHEAVRGALCQEEEREAHL